MAPLAATESPFTPPPPRAAARDAEWLRPELVIRAEFAGWTGDGFVRQAAYKGIELEKHPRSVIRERPKAESG
jgi:bifunctional non-homologous end joining protein LigD